jgi:septal ring factor EnvC (AmiA/AmiB activator)
MISFNSNSMPNPVDLKLISDLVALLADPKKARERIDQFERVTVELRAKLDEMKSEQAGFTAAQAEHRAKLDQGQAAHEATLRDEEQRTQQLQALRENALAACEKRLAEAERKLEAAIAANDERKADLDRRLALLRSVSAA